MKKDGHIHSPFCPHGTKDPFEKYIEKAIEENFTEITFTEHAPLPTNFVDPTPNKDSGMAPKYLTDYLDTLKQLKKQYKDQIKINVGLEIDYIVGYETEVRALLDIVGPVLDDAILSVHFLKHNDTYTCIDFSEEVYLEFAQQVGGMEALYNLYYDTVLKSIDANLGRYKPRRIGHPSLVHKFQLAHGEKIDDDHRIIEVLKIMQEKGYILDVNSAGLSKPFCKEPYPPMHMIEYARSISLPMIFGSDAHSVKDLHQHYELIMK
ncbi:histidinol-phosphatase HisJ [Ureibacillus chungkukjangi]|uniref:Histidinol-phosphatase n=1 Tax=Ureibacillus chungkukjangi TaxID=1202712 RepID=A0A318TXP5_9BACL|nr:histidinol-phosphatase HisJ [Ureibacillus chungkukjangi]MCM3387455.1 histidinol-phosphatase HisJ [Ureibacillus chungkukjangi]PYF09063.1 histidinol-phosphatase (PHP family) [Ureibacillus chungkukjangi]